MSTEPNTTVLAALSAFVGGIFVWVGNRVMNAPDKAKADVDAARAETAKVLGELEAVKQRLGVLEQQVSGDVFGLVPVVGRLAVAIERLDKIATTFSVQFGATMAPHGQGGG